MTILQQRIEDKLKFNDTTFIISYDEEDDPNFDLSQEYGLSELILKRKDSQLSSEYPRVVELVSIQINPRLRRMGLSKKVLGELVDWADMTGTVLTGDPDDMFGTPINVLIALTQTPLRQMDALCELIDNAIDSFSAAKRQGIKIDKPCVSILLPKITAVKNNLGCVRIIDNGPGLAPEDAEKVGLKLSDEQMEKIKSNVGIHKGNIVSWLQGIRAYESR